VRCGVTAPDRVLHKGLEVLQVRTVINILTPPLLLPIPSRTPDVITVLCPNRRRRCDGSLPVRTVIHIVPPRFPPHYIEGSESLQLAPRTAGPDVRRPRPPVC